jgi:peptide/nickel transport system substrate-binding protein
MHFLLMDQLISISFGGGDKDFAPMEPASPDSAAGKDSPWPAWVQWSVSRGAKGMEPPPQIKQLVEWRSVLAASTDPKARREAAKKLLDSQAENLWYIGTVSMAPQPILVSKRLKNVPEKGLWDWRLGYFYAMYPMQWYLE